MVFYFRSDGDLCSFAQKNDGTFQITMYEPSNNGEFEVFYLERFRKFETAMDALLKKGIEYDQLYTPTLEDLNMMMACCKQNTGI